MYVVAPCQILLHTVYVAIVCITYYITAFRRASMTWVDRMLSFRRTMAANRAFDGEHPLLAFAQLQDAAPLGVDLAPAVQLAGGATMPFVDDPAATVQESRAPRGGPVTVARTAGAPAVTAAGLRAAGQVPVDRFGELDIITGHPVRDLKLDPVRQLVQWTGPLFGGGDEGPAQ